MPELPHKQNRTLACLRTVIRPVTAAAIPVLVYMLINTVLHRFPAGDGSLLIWDMNWQYSDYFAHLHDILHGEASALYSFSEILGGSMTGNAAYYLMSPFNLLFWFFDASHIYAGILIVTLCKIASLGLSSYFYFRHLSIRNHAGDRYGFSVILAVCNALSAYVICYAFNIMWLDALIMLPLLMISVDDFIDRRHCIRYSVIMFLCVFTCYYTGYMLCLFTVFYFLTDIFLLTDPTDGTAFVTRTRCIIYFLLYSVLGLMLSCIVLIPVYYAMHGTKSSLDLSSLLSLSLINDPLHVLIQLIPGCTAGRVVYGSPAEPLIYCGLMASACAIGFFASGLIPIRNKIGYLLLSLLFLMSMCFRNLNVLWHGLNEPSGSPYRYSFIFILIILSEAYIFLIRQDNIRMPLMISAAAVTVLTLLSYGTFRAYSSHRIWFLDLMLMAVYLIILFICILRHASDHSWSVWLIMVLTLAELTANAFYQYHASTVYTDCRSASDTAGYAQTFSFFRQYTASQKDGFYRSAIRNSAVRTSNDNFAFNLYGTQYYASDVSSINVAAATGLGYNASLRGGGTFGHGSARGADDLIGIKYYISASEDPMPGMKKITEKNGFTLWQNDDALPLGILTDRSVLDIPDNKTPFERLNALYSSLIVPDTGVPVQKDNIYKRMTVSPSEIKSGLISYTLHSADKSDLRLYAYIPDPENTVSGITVRQGTFSYTLPVITPVEFLDLASLLPDPDSSCTVEFELTAKMSPDKADISFYTEDTVLLKKYIKTALSQKTATSVISDSRINLKYNTSAENAILMTTIPYDAGWHARIDGKKADIIRAGNFCAAVLPAGSHTVSLRFIPRGLTCGAILFTLAVFMIAYLTFNKKYQPADMHKVL